MTLAFAPERIEHWPLARLQPYAKNAKMHGPDQVAKLAASMAEFGWTVPCLVAENGELIAGHGRVLAATQLGLTEAPVIVLGHLTEAQRRAYRLADNKLTELGTWDEALLSAELNELLADDYDLSLVGFSDGELDKLLAFVPEGEGEEGAGAGGTVPPVVIPDPRVRVVSFTGSTGVGRTLLKGAADQVLKPAMELGGNAPVIVFDDADLDVAVEGTMLAKMRNLGEACTAANRIYVHEKIADEFTRRLSAAMSALKIGDGTDPSVDVGPLVNAATRDKVAEFVADAMAKGAKLECGGVVPEGKGYFYPPTVLSNVPETADCVHDEIFGPVAALQTFRDQDDVIARANDTEYGLVAYVFSGDMKRGLQVCERLDYGMVGLNRGLVSDPAAPFGGTKQSGLGREGGHEGMLEFMETQYISASW